MECTLRSVTALGSFYKPTIVLAVQATGLQDLPRSSKFPAPKVDKVAKDCSIYDED